MDIKTYIINRLRYLRNKVNYQYGYTSAEEIVYGLLELSRLAEWAGFFDLKDTIYKKYETLRELLLHKGTPRFADFLMNL